MSIDGLAPVTVVRNGKMRAAGRRLDDVVVYDWGFQLNGRHHEQRSYVLLDDGFQINQDDLWIDVIVGPPDHPYRVLDLDEYAAAARDGALTPAEAADGLVRTQRFLDRRLNRRHETLRAWPRLPTGLPQATMTPVRPIGGAAALGIRRVPAGRARRGESRLG
ncbi:hypothetical protein ACN27F_27160 [Solwaraspora sp. WMMB335]|uniref:hypothetical protein n=1 Tax=Solwaraspora sp. WMMB335 TaxID=3404118 RepID=UPI003B92DF8A